MTEYSKKILTEGFSQFGVKASDEQISQLEKYMDFLLEQNKVMNLTAITDEKEFVIKHFVDNYLNDSKANNGKITPEGIVSVFLEEYEKTFWDEE